MAHHKSALKRIKTSNIQRIRNKGVRSYMRSQIKSWTALLDQGNLDEAKAAFPKLESVLNRTVAKGVLKKTTISRKVSRLAKALSRAEATKQA